MTADPAALTEAEREDLAWAYDAAYYYGDSVTRAIRAGTENMLIPAVEQILAVRLDALLSDLPAERQGGETRPGDDVAGTEDEEPVGQVRASDWERPETSDDKDALAAPAPVPDDEHVLAVILAGVRCQLIHGQVNGGRCPNCISWAKTIAAPEHAPRLAQHTAAAVDAALVEAERALTKALAGISTHNGTPVTPENLRWAATHEALCRSYIFDVLTELADALGRELREGRR